MKEIRINATLLDNCFKILFKKVYKSIVTFLFYIKYIISQY